MAIPSKSAPATTRLAGAAFLVAASACGVAPLHATDIAGQYGCQGCLLGGEHYYLFEDGSYRICRYSDQPLENGLYAQLESGTFSFDGAKLRLVSARDRPLPDRYLVRSGGNVFMLDQEGYEAAANSTKRIQDLGWVRTRLPADRVVEECENRG